MVLVLKLGRLNFLELLSERRHGCRYVKARERNATEGRQSSKNSLSVLSIAQVFSEYVLTGRSNGGVLSVIFIFLMRSR